MPNPRFMSQRGEPTPELLERMALAKQIIHANAPWFAEKYSPLREEDIVNVNKIYLIGSHANEDGWMDETSDLDLKIVNGSDEIIPEYLFRFKREVLKPLLCQGEKRRWIDVYFVKEDYQVTDPKWDVTSYWNALEVKRE